MVIFTKETEWTHRITKYNNRIPTEICHSDNLIEATELFIDMSQNTSEMVTIEEKTDNGWFCLASKNTNTQQGY